MPLAEPRTHQAARSEAEQAGHQLFRASSTVIHFRIKGVQPRFDTIVHVREHAARGDGAHREREHADDDPAFPVGRHIQHAHEHREEHQRRTQITLNHQHAHRNRPDHHNRPQIFDARQLQSRNLLATHRKLVTMVEQVCREEERDEQFGEFARLQRIRADTNPDACAADGPAQARDHRGQQQYDADDHTHVREASQHTVITQAHHQNATQNQGGAQPDQLSGTGMGPFLLVDTSDQGDADAGEQQRTWQNRLACVRLELEQQRPHDDEQERYDTKQNRVFMRKSPGRAFKHLEEADEADSHGEQQQRHLAQTGDDHPITTPVIRGIGSWKEAGARTEDALGEGLAG